MKSVELLLELPVDGHGIDEFPDPDLLPRTGYEGRASGLNGEQFIQLGVVVTAASTGILRTWLVTRSERLKRARVSVGDKVFKGYTPAEIDRIISTLNRELGDPPDDA